MDLTKKANIYFLIITCISVFILYEKEVTAHSPVVLWHGMGDSCCFPFSMGKIKKLIESYLPGIYVRSIMIGDSITKDVESGYFGNLNNQISEVCEKLLNDSYLYHGFNAIGFSQGGQFLRALVQQCSSLHINNLISIGGQHQGIFGFPHCSSFSSFSICEYIRKLLKYAAYEKWVQKYLVQAQYWHDPLNEEEYKEKSVFLADVNNENRINETYKRNMKRLSNFVMVKFLRDTMVIPKESEWFGFYSMGQDSKVLPLQETELYVKDKLGLQEMDKNGKLHFLEYDGDHLQFDEEWFYTKIVQQYLA